MSSTASPIPRNLPPDQAAREHALDPARSVLVQAPAGSGKTDLLTRRFLRLLGTVDEPSEIVAITFTKPAAAEMRHRILTELEKAAAREQAPRHASDVDDIDESSMQALAARTLKRSQARAWNLIELSAQLRISTIDSFCRELAVRQPLLSGLGGGLEIFEESKELYRRAARRTLEQVDGADDNLRAAIEALLLWRDNGWQEMEDLLIDMLDKRDQWMHEFVVGGEQDWEALRRRLERPLEQAARKALTELSASLDRIPYARREALKLARLACARTGGARHRELAETVDFPTAFEAAEQLEEARRICACLAGFLQTQQGEWRSEKGLNSAFGFPATDAGRAAKKRFGALIADLRKAPGLEQSLAAVAELPGTRYGENEWQIVRSCFALLRRAAAELKVVFAEQGAVDYTEIAQIALHVLAADADGPGDTAMAVADGIRHLLVDEFQDTSRRQHELLGRLIAAWPEREGRTCFVVGDPMQSIYSFRDADAELFPQVRDKGLHILGSLPLHFDAATLSANFRTARPLVAELNGIFQRVFAADDGSGVTFAASEPAREECAALDPRLVSAGRPRCELHVKFVPRTPGRRSGDAAALDKHASTEREKAREEQTDEIVELIQSYAGRIAQARAEGRKYRVALLGRTHAALAPIAAALREDAIPFRAVDLEKLRERPEVVDAMALARAIVNPQDRIAWLGVLRAPWCGLSLADLHCLVSADDRALLIRPVPELLAEREGLLTEQGRAAVDRVRQAYDFARESRRRRPEASLGAWLEGAWLQVGGAACVDAASRANLDLLWSCLDRLPNGEQDLTGAAFDTALDRLTALPDPAAESNYGVQMMTIHKAKGLEFEVVIVPELQAGARGSDSKLLSWLERGLAEPDETGEVTEFLVAPLPPKGTEGGRAKRWVERQIHAREAQEMRRVLYVAASRAREELHLFARPAYKAAPDGISGLDARAGSLLAAAWPAMEAEIRAQFDTWRRVGEDGEVAAIAASGEARLYAMPAAAKPAVLRRLPAGYKIASHPESVGGAGDPVRFGSSPLYTRHEGGLLSRMLGSAVHALLEELAKLRTTLDWEPAREALRQMDARTAALVRASGVEPAQAAHMAAQALEIVLAASRDRAGQWILSPHRDAANEARWATVAADGVRALQADRVFRAGAQPGTEIGIAAGEGDDVWWIIDYKTAHTAGIDAADALPELRDTFSPQLEAYARALRNLHGTDVRICAGLYYPRMLAFDWWEM